jgi:hypothetical protein
MVLLLLLLAVLLPLLLPLPLPLLLLLLEGIALIHLASEEAGVTEGGNGKISIP